MLSSNNRKMKIFSQTHTHTQTNSFPTYTHRERPNFLKNMYLCLINVSKCGAFSAYVVLHHSNDPLQSHTIFCVSFAISHLDSPISGYLCAPFFYIFIFSFLYFLLELPLCCSKAVVQSMRTLSCTTIIHTKTDKFSQRMQNIAASVVIESVKPSDVTSIHD